MSMQATAGSVKKAVPASKNVDPSYGVHKCGMSADFEANGFDTDDVKEAVVAHADSIARAIWSGKQIPVHPRPGIQLLAFAVATKLVEQSAKRFADFVHVDIDALTKTAASDHVSSC